MTKHPHRPPFVLPAALALAAAFFMGFSTSCGEEKIAFRDNLTAIAEKEWAKTMTREVKTILDQAEKEQEAAIEEGVTVTPLARKVAVCIDTSGSISGFDLENFVRYVGETFGTGESGEVHLIIGDTEVDWQGPYEGPETFAIGSDAYLAATWQGRGGTDFRGLIRAGAEADPQVILYLTDGFGTLPQEVPDVPIFWVLNRQCWTGTDGTLYDYNCKELRRFGEITSLQDP